MNKLRLSLAIASGLILGVAACGQNPDNDATIGVDAPPADAPEVTLPAPELFPSLEAWRINEGASISTAEMAVDGITGPIYKLDVGPSAQVLGFNDELPIKAGDTVSVTLAAWADNDETEGRFRIARFCSADNNEQTVITRNLSTTPGKITFSHTFEFDHSCARLQIDARSENTTFYVAEIDATKD